MSFNLDTCRSKDELEAFAKEMFKVDLDKRKKLDELKDEVRTLIAGSLNDDAVTPETADGGEDSGEDSGEKAPMASGEVEFVKHKKTGAVFHYHAQYKKRLGVDLIACDKKGKAV